MILGRTYIIPFVIKMVLVIKFSKSSMEDSNVSDL